MGKEITITNYEVMNAMASIKSLLQVDDKEFPIKARWNLMKNMKKFEALFKTYSELEYELIKQYAIKDDKCEIRLDDNNEPKFAPNNKKEYITKRDELLKCENTIDLLTISLSDLEGHLPNGEILYHLEFMIEE